MLVGTRLGEHLSETETKSITGVMRQFWGAHQRFFNQMCMGAKVPAAIRLAKRALENNQCVVIGLLSTGESRMEGPCAPYQDSRLPSISHLQNVLVSIVVEQFVYTYDPRTKQIRDYARFRTDARCTML